MGCSSVNGMQKEDFHEAAKKGHVDVILAHIESSITADLTEGKKARIALHCAANRSGKIDVIRAPLAAGARVDKADHKDGYTPLMCAVMRKNLAVVELLVAAAANIHIADRDGMTSLHIACEYNTPPAIVRRLINADAALNAVHLYGVTPLQWR